LAYIVHVDHLKRYRFVFKHLISGALRKKRSVKKRDVDDLCKTNISRSMEYSKGRIHVIQ